MIYPCPFCHQYLETERVIKGKAIKLHQCPHCFKQLKSPHKIKHNSKNSKLI